MKQKNLILFLGFFLASCTVVELAFYQTAPESSILVIPQTTEPVFTQTPVAEYPGCPHQQKKILGLFATGQIEVRYYWAKHNRGYANGL